eukprot:1291064-Pleurochrysis_carterae.AAC.1
MAYKVIPIPTGPPVIQPPGTCSRTTAPPSPGLPRSRPPWPCLRVKPKSWQQAKQPKRQSIFELSSQTS